MTQLRQLREEQARIATNARAKLDEITESTTAERAAEINREFDAMMADHDSIGARVEREEKLAGIEARAAEERARQRPLPKDTEISGQGDDDGPSYRNVFAKALCGGLEDMTPEERAILRAGTVKFEGRAQSTSNTAGGYTVPTEIVPMLARALKAWGPMYDADIVSEIVTSAGNALKVPTVDDTAKTGGAHTEGAALTDDGSEDVTFGQKSLDAYVFDTEFIRWSFELDADSIFNMEQLLSNLLGERLGRLANTQLTTGTGSSAPNGIVTASSLGKTAAGAAAITSDEVIDLLHSVDPAYRVSPKARFMFNDTTLQYLRKLKDGQGNYLWQMGDISKGVPGTLLGFQYSINQAMASIATGQKTILFGDFGQYYVRKVGAPVVGVLRERFWPDLGIAGLIRFDGELAVTGSIKHLIQA